MTRKALGRGLNALLQTVESATSGLEQVRLDRIDPNPFQPRRDFPEDSLKELADSIRASGVVQPILVAPQRPSRGPLPARSWRTSMARGPPCRPRNRSRHDPRACGSGHP